MFEYKVDNITVYCTSSFDMKNESGTRTEEKIACWIVECLEREIIADIFDKNYEGFSSEDKRYLVDKTANALEDFKEPRKKYIETRLKEYFGREHFINISGFIRFRLKDYRKTLEKFADSVVDKYICEKEYYEFIEMLKEYISLQKPLLTELHIVSEENKVRYLDKNLTEITEKLENEYSFETDLTADDKLLTILVLSAPKKIFWHNSHIIKNKELKRTIKEIFQERLIIYENCKIGIDNF